jgi:hypothetical protein
MFEPGYALIIADSPASFLPNVVYPYLPKTLHSYLPTGLCRNFFQRIEITSINLWRLLIIK